MTLDSESPLATVTVGVPARSEGAAVEDIPRGVSLGRFVVLSKLAAGGMGVVYAAYDPELDRKVALKLLHARVDPDEHHGASRLTREAQAMARLSHPNVLNVYEVGACEGRVFLAMELVEGSTLKQWLQGIRPAGHVPYEGSGDVVA